MERLYLDNYRGFKNQFIEVRDVNFMVGENSTGKSSVLFALNTIFNPSFWTNLDFSGDDFQAYSFDDLVSAEVQDKSYFRLGYVYDNSEKASFVFEFRNDGGRPAILKAVISNKAETFYAYLLKDTQELYSYETKGQGILFDTFDTFENSVVEKYNMTQLPTTPAKLLDFCEMRPVDKKYKISTLPIPLMSFTAPIRSRPRKTYDEPATPVTSEGGHVPYRLRKLFRENGLELKKSLNEFGKQSGLFNDIVIKDYEGSSDDAPFRLCFILDKTPINIVNVGYGVSQVLPVLFDMLTTSRTVVAIQQAEVHLHPKAQAALGDVFFDLSLVEPGKRLMIETHSDYIIDRFRQRQKKADVKADAHILFFSRKEGKNIAYSINIDGSGAYAENQPEEFREFFITEAMENLGI
jgi:hypothetical protein